MNFRWLLPTLLWMSCAVEGTDVRLEPVDFGVVSTSGTHFAELAVKNVGSQPVKLLRVERRSGEGFTITPTQVALIPGERAKWKVVFEAPTAGLFEGRFAAVFDSGTFEFTVRARAAAQCAAQPFFDLGDARVGGRTSRTMTVSNPLDEPAAVFIGEPAAPFSVEPSGTLRLAARESRELTVSFAPTSAGRPSRTWIFTPSADCTATELQLTALSFDAPLTFAPGRLDFGVLTPGLARPRSVEVRNHTRGDLTLTTISFSHPAFRSTSSLPLLVPANGVASLEVEALGTDATPFDGALRVTTDAVEQPELSLPLLANRLAPCLLASPAQLTFADVEAGCHSSDARISLTNTCPHPVRLSEGTPSSGFVFTAASPPDVLEPGATVEFALGHTPVRSGLASGALTFDADVLDGNQRLVIPLTGLATPATEVEESELIPSGDAPVDVLFIIDDSPSMLPLATSVADNLGSFARYVLANQFDTRMGVMTTSTAPGELGRLRAPWVANPSPSALQTAGSVRGVSLAPSSCLETLHAALLQPTPLDGMLRPRVGLYVICITNGRDGLEVAPMPLISSIIDRMPRPSAVAVVAHFQDVTGCNGTLEHGPLSAFVGLTNGVREEICTPHWSVALERLGKNSFGYRTRFYLHQTPALSRGPLRVFLNELELPSRDPVSEESVIWAYDGAQNSVNFEPLYTPAPGATLRFRYAPNCH